MKIVKINITGTGLRTYFVSLNDRHILEGSIGVAARNLANNNT